MNRITKPPLLLFANLSMTFSDVLRIAAQTADDVSEKLFDIAFGAN